MLFPEKMIDFVRTPGPLFICGESLGKILAKMSKEKNKKTIKIKFEQTFKPSQGGTSALSPLSCSFSFFFWLD